MKTREQAARFIERQMNPKSDYKSPPFKGSYVHYGMWELRDLMDFIYEGEPTKEEEIKSPQKRPGVVTSPPRKEYPY